LSYALNLTLDAAASLQIERVYGSLGALGIAEHDLVTQYGPCVTILVIADSVHWDDVLETLRRFVPKADAIAVAVTEPCIILGTPPTLGLRVSPADGLLALHNALYRCVPEQAVHLHYRPAYWQPHIKLANVSGDQSVSSAVSAAMARSWQQMQASLTALEVIRFPPVEAIWHGRLRRAAEADDDAR
jgi:hypothetical protein